MTESVDDKVKQAKELAEQWSAGVLTINHPERAATISVPGRPQFPELISPRDLPPRKLNSLAGHAAFIHALAHIEFNAINLALDAIYRFPQLPNRFYTDWVQVAAEEAYHFQLLHTHLHELGFSYGDFPAHNGLWEMAIKTEEHVLLRMALVPRVLEARGLDVTPAMMARLVAYGDHRGAEILKVILEDEIGHVEIGNRWFQWACEQEQRDAQATFQALIEQYLPGRIKGPFHREARLAAGFSDAEIDWMESL